MAPRYRRRGRIGEPMIDDTFLHQLRAGPLAGLDASAQAVFVDRVDVLADDLLGPLGALYPDRPVDEIARALIRLAARRHAERPVDLRRLDTKRLSQPDWFQAPEMVGYATYTDRFAGDLPGVVDRIGYLRDLGVRYLHLMPLLRPREGENDGGYAVADHDAVDPRLGTMADLESLAAALRESDISLCIDVVANHTADTHPWAQAALAGDPTYQAYYFLFPDRDLADTHERHLREIFPDTDPGNFTWQPEIGRWAWTTFHDYQWDLDYSNPQVLVEMTDVLLRLANRGAEVLRLDAVAFLWKRLGTPCENLPEAHAILQVWRAITRLACPGVLLLAEAIVPIEQTKPYLGTGRATGRECHLAYHHFLMVLLWSALAERRAGLATAALSRAGAIPPDTSWCTYVRSHDDIGWAITPADTATVGLDDHAHRSFLTDFYTGTFPGSWARGDVFQFNPRTADRRVVGTTASLAGLEAALADGDPIAEDRAIARIGLLHAVVAAHGGIPLIWSGDELGLTNDDAWRSDPSTADDNRWMHRPRLPEDGVAARNDPSTPAGRVFGRLAAIMRARARCPEVHAAAPSTPVHLGTDDALGILRHGARGRLLVVANVTDRDTVVPGDRLGDLGFGGPRHDRLAGEDLGAGDLALDPYACRWLVPGD